MGKNLDKLKARLNKRRDRSVTPYDLFMVAITLLAFVNLILYLFMKQETLLYTISIIDLLLSALFFLDFLRLFLRAERKMHYFFREFGWADLLASLPFPQFKLFRIFRLAVAYKLLKRAGFQGVRRGVLQNRAATALLIVIFTIIILLEFGSVGILMLEQGNPDSNIKTASDAIWWVYVSITTVGYGDTYPVTSGGRTFATLVLLVGVGLFGVVTGFLANKFLPSANDSQDDSNVQNKDASIEQLREEVREIRQLLVEQRGNEQETGIQPPEFPT